MNDSGKNKASPQRDIAKHTNLIKRTSIGAMGIMEDSRKNGKEEKNYLKTARKAIFQFIVSSKFGSVGPTRSRTSLLKLIICLEHLRSIYQNEADK